MKKTFKYLIIGFLFVLILGVSNLKAQPPKLEMEQGASIRVAKEGIEQGLRFTATLDKSMQDKEHGFYLIYGVATVEDLKTAINGDMIINGKVVYEVTIDGVNTNDQFRVVLTGIPEIGYLDNISVVAYYKDGVDKVFVDAPVTRSVGEVALKLAEIGDDSGDDVINYLQTLKRVRLNAFGEVEVTNNLLETNHFLLRDEFIKDWNKKFNTEWTELDPSVFFNSARAGLDGAQGSNNDLSGSNLYEFFNDEDLKDKWDFILQMAIIKGSGKTHPMRQANAILGNGQVIDPAKDEPFLLYFGSHLIYTIANYFNQSDDTAGYAPADFLQANDYSGLDHLYETIYINVDNYEFYNIGDTFALPEAKVRTGYDFKHYKLDSETFAVGVDYEITQDNTLLALVYEPIEYQVKFYDGDVELTDLALTYNIEDEISLPDYDKEGFVFDGWYDNPNFDENVITQIKKGSIGAKTFYAKTTESANVPVEVTYVLNGGKLNADDLIEYRDSTHVIATRYSTAGDSGGLCITVGPSRGGLHWYTMGFKETDIDKVYELIGKGVGYENEEADLFISYHDLCASDYESVIQNLYNNVAVPGYLVVVPWLPSAVTGSTSIDMYFMPASVLAQDTVVTTLTLETDLLELIDPFDSFLGWYEDEYFQGEPVLKFPGYLAGDGITEVTYYANWGGEIEYKVTYDFGEYGYIGDDTKEDLFLDFVTDYKEFYGRTGASIEDLLTNFAAKAYLPEQFHISSIFDESYQDGKWVWLRDHILDIATNEAGYTQVEHLNSWDQTYWRANIEAFFMEKQFSYAGLYPSADFTTFDAANGFWKHSDYSKQVEIHVNNGDLLNASTISVWNSDYEFDGWYDENDQLVTKLPSSVEAHYTLYAKWVLK